MSGRLDVCVEVDACGKQSLCGFKSRVTREERAQCPVLHEHD